MESSYQLFSTGVDDVVTEPGDPITEIDTFKVDTPAVIKSIEIAIGIVGFLVNMMVIIVIVNSRVMKRTNTNMYIINQSCIDAIVALMLIFITQFEDDGRMFHGVGDTLFCVAWISRVFFFGPLNASTYNMLIMTFERYLSVVKPIWHRKHVNPKIVGLSLLISWLIGIGFHMCVKFPTTHVTNGKCLTYQFDDLTYKTVAGIIHVFFFYTVPLIALFFCNCHIALALRKRIKPIQPVSSSAKNDRRDRAQKNIIKTLLVVGGAFLICASPSNIQFLIFNLGVPLDMTSTTYHAIVLLSFVNCAIYPFVYVATYQQFQWELKKFVLRKMCGKKIFIDSEATETATNATEQ